MCLVWISGRTPTTLTEVDCAFLCSSRHMPICYLKSKNGWFVPHPILFITLLSVGILPVWATDSISNAKIITLQILSELIFHFFLYMSFNIYGYFAIHILLLHYIMFRWVAHYITAAIYKVWRSCYLHIIAIQYAVWTYCRLHIISIRYKVGTCCHLCYCCTTWSTHLLFMLLLPI
jgi:hypothetical protein